MVAILKGTSKRTIRRVAKQSRTQFLSFTRCPPWVQHHIDDRLTFAKRHLHRPRTDWNKASASLLTIGIHYAGA